MADKKQRFDYIDQFRGLMLILMLIDHASYYFNSIWLYLDPFDPLFDSWGQFALRYSGYPGAPGFLIIAGAMIWWSYTRKVEKGQSVGKVRWQFIQRGVFLIFLQLTWVNSSWGGFRSLNLWHMGIIGSIGFCMIFLALIVHIQWQYRLLISITILLLHPVLLKITSGVNNEWQQVLVQTFIDAGKFNKYPVLPWFAISILGSVMATGWLSRWTSIETKIKWSLIIGTTALLIATGIRLGRGFGNFLPYSDFGTYSYFLNQKYPASLNFSLGNFGIVVLLMAAFIWLNKVIPRVMFIFTIPGRVSLFFYMMHIAIMGVFIKRFDFLYREGGVRESLIAFLIMMCIMIPLSLWFYKVKRRSSNYFIRMI